MKKKTWVYLGIFSAIVFYFAVSQFLTSEMPSQPGKNNSGSPSLNLPPSSLDLFYPPNTKQPVYLIRMFDLAEKFTGILIDLAEEDLPNIRPSFEQFKEDFVSVSKLVSEWEDRYPIDPVDELGEAINSGEKGRIMSAYEKVGHTCHSCHIEYMAGVKAKYHWQDFRNIKIEDPILKTEVDFVQLMRNLNYNFSGVTYDLKQGQIERALENARAFQMRFQSSIETCQECHGTSERQYYVDDDIQQTVASLIQALSKNPTDEKEIANHVMTIGMESCFKCHLVHVPSAYLKYQMEEKTFD